MRLGEALIWRQDYESTLGKLKSRILKNIVVREGSKPLEDPIKLVEIYLHKLEEYKQLVTKINETNSILTIKGGKTMTEALAEREEQLRNHNTFKTIASKAFIEPDYNVKKRVKKVSLLNVTEYQQRSDDSARQVRQIDAAIQGNNWSCDLIE